MKAHLKAFAKEVIVTFAERVRFQQYACHQSIYIALDC